MTRFEPLTDHLLLKLEPTPERSSIIVAANTKEDLVRFGTVLAVGPEVRDIEVGQKVLASITAGVEMPQGMLVSEQAVYATI